MERITFETSEIANVPAQTQGITNRPLVDEVIKNHRHQLATKASDKLRKLQ
jgi:hypothetical protein